MNEQSAMRALILKDARVIAPLVMIGWLCCLACNLVLFLAWQYWNIDKRSLFNCSVAAWSSIPGIVAFGAASMLIGTEEDSGTLSWLRTLPVTWRQIAASKLVVGLGALASVWLLSTLVFWIFSHGWRATDDSRFFERLSFDDALSVLFFQLLVLLLGFVVSYWIRSPVAGLLTLVPVFVFVTVFFSFVTEVVLDDWHDDVSLTRFVVGVGFLGSIAIIQLVLARRRMTRPDSSRSVLSTETFESSSRYRPPSFGISSKPSQTAALLWQQCRQTAPAGVSMIGISILLMIVFVLTRDRPMRLSSLPILLLGGMAPLSVALSACWLGAITFYGDNQRHRHAFLADRGIAPTQIWWTRIVPPLIGCLVLASAVLAFGHVLTPSGSETSWTRDWALLALIVVLFAFGQLVSQGIDRPILAFLAAPAYAFICLIPVFYLLDGWPAVGPLLLFTTPVLFFASWRLSKRWLEDRDKTGHAIQVLGYTIVAVGLPCLMYAGSWLILMASRHF